MPDQVIGTILDDASILESHARIWLSEGERSWQGSFVVAHGSKVRIDGDGKYRLQLDDVRSGTILITGYKPSAAGIVVTFQGSGPLG